MKPIRLLLEATSAFLLVSSGLWFPIHAIGHSQDEVFRLYASIILGILGAMVWTLLRVGMMIASAIPDKKKPMRRKVGK